MSATHPVVYLWTCSRCHRGDDATAFRGPPVTDDELAQVAGYVNYSSYRRAPKSTLHVDPATPRVTDWELAAMADLGRPAMWKRVGGHILCPLCRPCGVPNAPTVDGMARYG